MGHGGAGSAPAGGAVPEAGILARETLPHLGRLLVRRGDPDADAVLARAWQLGERSDSLPVLLPTGAAYLEKAWLDASRDASGSGPPG